MTDPDILEALRGALDKDPHNGLLWLHYADLLSGADRPGEAIAALRVALEQADTAVKSKRRLLPLLRETGQLAEALIRVEQLLAECPDDQALHIEHGHILDARGDSEEADEAFARGGGRTSAGLANKPPSAADKAAESTPREKKPREPLMAEVRSEAKSDPDDWAAQFDWGDLRLTFADVAGLADVKQQIRLRIIAPFKQPEIYEAFGREGGGGILLYGPPGCGKTYIARATAGECGARFMSVSIHDIVDKYWGESEKLVHALFEDARRKTPTVLFFDEFDALGGSRGRGESQFWKTLVDQLLQEMDGIEGNNRDVLLFAATNTPWNVDPAFRRPGRFDRVLFVPPPDTEARQAILHRHAGKLPGGSHIDTKKVAKATSLFTGADLRSLCERAAEDALGRSLESGKVHEVTNDDFKAELDRMTSSAQEWLATARNYAKYTNEGGQYDELTGFLKKTRKY